MKICRMIVTVYCFILLLNAVHSFFLIPFWFTSSTTGSSTISVAPTASIGTGSITSGLPGTTVGPGRKRRELPELNAKAQSAFIRQKREPLPTGPTTPGGLTITTVPTGPTTTVTKPGQCPSVGLYNPFCFSCTLDSQCPGIQRCCPAGFSGKNCCFAVFFGG